MKRLIYKSITLMMVFLVLGTTSCDDTLDINTSPNNPGSSTPAFTLPAAQASMAYAISLDLGILSGFQSQYWTQAPTATQYAAFERYTYNGTATSAGWAKLYASAMEDFKFIREQAIEDGTPNYAAVADFLTAYSLQVATDMWGDVPYTDALQGKDGNLTPQYDAGEDIYDELIAIIDRGLSNVDLSAIAINISTEDFVYAGDMKKWVKFANTLKLRIFMRQIDSSKSAAAAAGITALMSSGVEFLGVGEDGFVPYSGGTNNENPYYSGDLSANSILNGVNVIASNTILDRLNAAGDPRIDLVYNVATTGPSTDGHEGVVQGQGADPAAPSRPATDYSTPGTTFAGASSPVYFITAYESLFLQAEAAERGLGGGVASTLYDDGVQAAFDLIGAGSANFFTGTGGAYEYGVTTVSGEVAPSGLADIQYQKWLAMNGTQNVEAWSEYRRNRIPADLSITFVAGTLPTGFPMRALYPTSEVSNNPNTPAVGVISDKIWWVTRF